MILCDEPSSDVSDSKHFVITVSLSVLACVCARVFCVITGEDAKSLDSYSPSFSHLFPHHIHTEHPKSSNALDCILVYFVHLFILTRFCPKSQNKAKAG